MQNKTKQNTIKIATLTTAISLTGFLLFLQTSKASNSISQLSQQSSDETQQKIEELQKRAEVYRQIIDIKKKQSETLNDQLSVTDSNIESVQNEIDLNKAKIDNYNSQIRRLELQIKEKEGIMSSQKKILSDLMQSYYEVNLVSPVVSYLNGSNIAAFMVNKDRLSQAGDKIAALITSVASIKADLEKQGAEIDQKKADVLSTHEDLESKNIKLAAVKQQREALLTQTKGEELKYQELLKRVEAQKQELLDIDQFFAASGLSVDSYPKPDSKYFASTSWYFSQRDPKWGNETIGSTKTLMKSYGCAVTAVAMVFKEAGGSIDPGQLSEAPIFSGDLINWPASWSSPKLSLISGKSHGNINWSTIDAQLEKDNPVIIYIGKTKGGGGHYVVVHHKTKEGKYVVHDPYFGANIFLDTSRALVGAMGVSSSTIMNQMIIYN
jgi:hypothetical protein